jgi:hypothetical protein
MRKPFTLFLASVFLLLAFGFIVFKTYLAVMAWLSVPDGPATVVFDGRDTKLMLVWIVCLPVLLYFAIWPEAFRKSSSPKYPKVGFKECMFFGAAISGLLSLQQVLFSGGYLERAETYSRQYGYTVICNEIGYKYRDKLIMAKSKHACDET